MFKKAQGVVGLEINSSFIQAVEFGESAKGLKPYKMETIPTPPGVIKDGILTDENLMVNTIEKLFQEKGFNAKQIVMILPEGTVITRFLKIPDMPRAEIKEIVKGEVEQYGLFPMKEAIFDFCVLEKLPEGKANKINLMLAITQKSIIDSYSKVFEKAGLKLIAVNFPLQAALRTLPASEFPPGELTSLIIIGESTCEINILRGSVPCFGRTIDFGTKLRDLIPDEIDDGKFSPAMRSHMSAEESTLLFNDLPLMVELLNEIRRSLDYFQTNLTEGKRIKKALLIANKDKFQGLDNFIGKALGMEVKFAEADSLSLSIGAAKYGMQKAALDGIVLLIPPSKRRSILTGRELTLAAGLFLLGIFSFSITGSLLDKKIKLTKKELLSQQQKLDEVGSIVEGISLDRLSQMKAEEGLNEKIELVMKTQYPGLSRVLIELSKRSPQNIWLTGLSAEGKNRYIKLTGVALSHSAVNQFIKSLSSCSLFKTITLTSTRFQSIEGQSAVEFGIQFQITEKGENVGIQH